MPSSSAAVPIWSRPAPPPKQRALGREEIVAAAINLLDELGAAALTMKAVAARLGSYSAMALYRYVYNKDGLVDLMLDAVTAEIAMPERTGDWRVELHTLAVHSRQMIGRHPWFAALVHTRAPAGPHQMRRLEFMLTLLTEQGATLDEAMTYAALIDRHIIGSGSQEAEEARFSSRHGLRDHADFLAAVEQVRALAAKHGDCPLLAHWLGDPVGGSADEQFELGLGFLLDGVATRLAGRVAARQ